MYKIPIIHIDVKIIIVTIHHTITPAKCILLHAIDPHGQNRIGNYMISSKKQSGGAGHPSRAAGLPNCVVLLHDFATRRHFDKVFTQISRSQNFVRTPECNINGSIQVSTTDDGLTCITLTFRFLDSKKKSTLHITTQQNATFQFERWCYSWSSAGPF